MPVGFQHVRHCKRGERAYPAVAADGGPSPRDRGEAIRLGANSFGAVN